MSKSLSTDYFKMAKRFNKKNKSELENRKLHFRGNFFSYSLISLDIKTPEEGKGGYTIDDDGKKALSEIEAVLQEKRKNKGLLRDQKINKVEGGLPRFTPEKELQSWIIERALASNGLLPFNKLEQVGKIEFVTSELVLPLNKKICEEVNNGLSLSEKRPLKQKDIRNDILGIDEEGNLIIIELKSKRNLDELCGQVNIFSYLALHNYKDTVREVVKIMTGRDWDGKSVRKVIVWPSAKSSKSTLGKLVNTGIVVIGYDAVYGSRGGAPKYSDNDEVNFVSQPI